MKDTETGLQAAIDYHHTTHPKRLDDLLWIHANELPAREKFVLLAMSKHASSGRWEDGQYKKPGTEIRPSVQTIADLTGYSRRSILEIQPKMIEAGYVVVVRRAPKQPKAGPGRGITNQYRIDLDKLIPPAELAAYRNYRRYLPEIRKGAKSAPLGQNRKPEKVQNPPEKVQDLHTNSSLNSSQKNSNAAANTTVEASARQQPVFSLLDRRSVHLFFELNGSTTQEADKFLQQIDLSGSKPRFKGKPIRTTPEAVARSWISNVWTENEPPREVITYGKTRTPEEIAAALEVDTWETVSQTLSQDEYRRYRDWYEERQKAATDARIS